MICYVKIFSSTQCEMPSSEFDRQEAFQTEIDKDHKDMISLALNQRLSFKWLMV